MVSKKEILAAPYVKRAFFDGHWQTFVGDMKTVIENLQKYSVGKDNLTVVIDYYEGGYEFPKFVWDVPMTPAEIETEKYRREKIIKEMDLRRNRKKRVESVKAAKNIEEVIALLAEDPDLFNEMIKKL